MWVVVVEVIRTSSGHFEWVSTATWMVCPIYGRTCKIQVLTIKPMASPATTMGEGELLWVPSAPVTMGYTLWTGSSGLHLSLATTLNYGQWTSSSQCLDGLHTACPRESDRSSHNHLNTLQHTALNSVNLDCWFLKSFKASGQTLRMYLYTLPRKRSVCVARFS